MKQNLNSESQSFSAATSVNEKIQQLNNRWGKPRYINKIELSNSFMEPFICLIQVTRLNLLHYIVALCVGSKHSDVVTADQEESASENAIKSELNCSMSEEERDPTVCSMQEHGDTADMPGGLTCRLADSGKGLYNPTEQTATVGLKPDTSSTDSFDESMLPSQETTSSEALDLTGYVRKHKSPATKRKRHSIRSNYVHTNKEVRLHDLWTAVSVQDVDNCSNSGSIVCVKDETPSPYADAEWSSCLNMPTFLEGSSLGKQSYHKASSSLGNSNSLKEDVANAGLSQADHNLSTLVKCLFLFVHVHTYTNRFNSHFCK